MSESAAIGATKPVSKRTARAMNDEKARSRVLSRGLGNNKVLMASLPPLVLAT